jgi:hypothetical protein
LLDTLSRQWSAPLTGPTAPPGALLLLAGAAEPAGPESAVAPSVERRGATPGPAASPLRREAPAGTVAAELERPLHLPEAPAEPVPPRSWPVWSRLTAAVPPAEPSAPVVAQSVARPAEWADEDLEAVAVRLKRLLDEQARRHGIDV